MERHFSPISRNYKCCDTNKGSFDAAHEKVDARVPLRDFANGGSTINDGIKGSTGNWRFARATARIMFISTAI